MGTTTWLEKARPDLSEIAILIGRPVSALIRRGQPSLDHSLPAGWYARAEDGSLWFLIGMSAISLSTDCYLIRATAVKEMKEGLGEV